ncbi:hypothetical protein Tco_0977784 [Tanacetum coccineum]|uniref:Reverse transcriptase domain-containing protein n=1 Tax=Tanacetum coccineum TaxID=301880 RepID=A0ABQ5EM55_9ASTR
MPRHIKTYDGSEDPEDHLKIFQAAAKTERWDMPTWCHMFNSTLTGNARVWFDDLPTEFKTDMMYLKEDSAKLLQRRNASRSHREILNNTPSSGMESSKDFVKQI